MITFIVIESLVIIVLAALCLHFKVEATHNKERWKKLDNQITRLLELKAIDFSKLPNPPDKNTITYVPHVEDIFERELYGNVNLGRHKR